VSEAGDAARTPVGERLLRGPEVAAAAAAVDAEVEQQLAAALHGPVGTALAASTAPMGAPPGGQPAGSEDVPALLGAAVPRMFIAAGAALTAAYLAVAEGDEVRAAGAVLCARRRLFPDDALGSAAVAGAARPALESLPAPAGEPGAPPGADAAAAMGRQVAARVEELERAYLGAAPHIETAALDTYSWKRATGGAGPASGAMRGHLGPFLRGMARWAFYVEAALAAIRQDDWVRAGAAIIAARRVTAQ
jgi:hypothetical protein